jgi:cytochrome b subunit of formate dehydrogenase
MSAEERAGMVAASSLRPRANPERLFFDQDTFSRGPHARLGCVDCHPSSDELPHPAQLPATRCDQCHPSQSSLYARGIHAERLAAGDNSSPRCWDCHGGHDILPPTARESRTYPLNIIAVCGGCHERHGASPDVPDTGRDLVDHYADSVHGRAVQQAGLAVAAVCPDCHRAHEIRPSREPESSVNRAHVPETCGRCHVSIVEKYSESVHSMPKHRGAGDERVPVCTSCHTTHRISRVDTPSFERDVVEECGVCHAQLYATYRESYHGQVNRLGVRRAARCSDCHGAHDVQSTSDPRSRLSGHNIVEACRHCHAGATANFCKFMPHADHRDRKTQPLLFGVWLYFMILMTGTFSFFGLHSVLWWIRSLIERRRSDRPLHQQARSGRYFIRFKRIDRITHALVITSFMGLTLTGLPLKFSDQPWALVLADALGGGNVAGLLHRGFAMVMFTYVAIHAVVVARWVLEQRRSGRKGWLFGPDSLLPRWKDLGDVLGMFKWFFGRGPVPRFDRWTYWEKFDYLADAAGTFIIGGSGLLLAFPIAASWILPGWLFNVATIVHGYEALLAIGFIFTIHFFNAHLRIEKFPADTVIFTGRISEGEMRHERPEQYHRLEQEGKLDKLLAAPKPAWRQRAATCVGVVLLAVGITLIVLIIWAGVLGLGH